MALQLVDLLYLSAANLAGNILTDAEHDYLCKVLLLFVRKFDQQWVIDLHGTRVSLKMLFLQMLERIGQRLRRFGGEGLSKRLKDASKLFASSDGQEEEEEEEEGEISEYDFATDFEIRSLD